MLRGGSFFLTASVVVQMQALGSVSFKVEGCTDEAARRVVSETVNWSSRPLTWPCLWTLNVAHQTSMPARTHARTTEDVNLVQLDAASRRPARAFGLGRSVHVARSSTPKQRPPPWMLGLPNCHPYFARRVVETASISADVGIPVDAFSNGGAGRVCIVSIDYGPRRSPAPGHEGRMGGNRGTRYREDSSPAWARYSLGLVVVSSCRRFSQGSWALLPCEADAACQCARSLSLRGLAAKNKVKVKVRMRPSRPCRPCVVHGAVVCLSTLRQSTTVAFNVDEDAKGQWNALPDADSRLGERALSEKLLGFDGRRLVRDQ